MIISSLFYTSSAILADDSSTTTSSKKDVVKVNNILNDEDDWHNENLKTIISIIDCRYQSLKIIDDFKYQFNQKNAPMIPERVLVKGKWFSDNEIDLANSLSKWYYSSDKFLLISSCELESLKSGGIIETYNYEYKQSNNQQYPKIYDLFSEDYTNKFLTRQTLKSSDNHVEWKHDSSLLTKLLKRKNEQADSSMVAINVNLKKVHWIFFVGIDFYKVNTTTNDESNNLRIYYFDSYNKCIDAISEQSMIDIKREKFSAICRLLKLILLFRRYQEKEDDSFIVKDSKTLNIRMDLYNRMKNLEDRLIYVKATTQLDTITCGLHIIRYFDEMLKIRKNLSSHGTFDRENFETELTKSQQLRLCDEQNYILKSELLEFFLNVNYAVGILTKCLKPFVFQTRDKVVIEDATTEIVSDFDTWNKNTKKRKKILRRSPKLKETPQGKIYMEIHAEVNKCLNQLKTVNKSTKACQCYSAFSRKEMRNVKTKNVDDIHQFEWDLVEKLRWKCPRTNTTYRGAGYHKSAINNRNPLFEKTSVPQVIKIWRPETNFDFEYKQEDARYWYKELLMNRLSFRCNLTEIEVPDGGSCCEWLTTLILLNETNESGYGRYLNKLRKLKKVAPHNFLKNSNDVLEGLRLSYAESISCEYQPNVNELFNLNTDEASDNALYCSSVLWNIYDIVKPQMNKFETFILQDCVRKFVALTPSQVGKVGCMYGTDDFLHWFQCVFNIRIFVINIQYFDTSFSTTCSFVKDEFRIQEEEPYEDDYKNDKYFDFNNKDNLIPYGIAIVLIEENHFDRIFKLHNSNSPIIPAGSDDIKYLLPFLRISELLWASLDIDEIEKHNTKVISSNKNDTHNELNFWFDHHYAMQNIRKDEMISSTLKDSEFVQSFISEDESYKPSPAIPCCAIRFLPRYIAYYIFFLATRQGTLLKNITENAEAFAINLEEEDIYPKYTDLLKKDIKKQQQKYGTIGDFFSSFSYRDTIRDTMSLYKERLHEYMILLINKQNGTNYKVGNKKLTKRIEFPRPNKVFNKETVNDSSGQDTGDKRKNSNMTNLKKRPLKTVKNITTGLENVSAQSFKKQQIEASRADSEHKGNSSKKRTRSSTETKAIPGNDHSKKSKTNFESSATSDETKQSNKTSPMEGKTSQNEGTSIDESHNTTNKKMTSQ